jgi:hypothetical protein
MNYAYKIEPLSCGGWGYVVYDDTGAIVALAGSQDATQVKANDTAHRIVTALRGAR